MTPIKIFFGAVLITTSAWASNAVAKDFFVAVRAHSGIEAAKAKWQPTLDYLNSNIKGHTFTMIPHPKIADQLVDAKQGKFQFLLTNPAAYVELSHTVKAKALVTLINKRQDTAQSQFGSVIFTRADRDDILNLQDIKGKHVQAVTPLGFGGWRVAWLEMLHNNINPHKDFAQLSYAGKQPKVVLNIQQGKADVGIVRTDMLERLAEKGKIKLTEFRILHNIETKGFPFFHSTPLYPEWPFAALPSADDEVASAVKQALLDLTTQHPAAQIGKYIGWTEALDYQSVDDLLSELRVGPYSKMPAELPTSTKNKNMLYTLGLLFLITSIVGYYLHKRSKRHVKIPA